MAKNDQRDVAKRLRLVADLVEAGTLEPAQLQFFRDSLLPALSSLLQSDVDFISIIAFGENCVIQDWLNTQNAPFFELSGRLHNLASTFSQIGIKRDLEGTETEHCQSCLCNDSCQETYEPDEDEEEEGLIN